MAVIDPRFAVSTSPSGAATVLHLVNTIEHGIDAAFRVLRVTAARRRTRKVIEGLSTRQLADIGLTQDAIDDVLERRIR